MNLTKKIFLWCTLLTISLPVNGFCELKSLDDNRLSEVYAQASPNGFSDFQINDLGDGLTETYMWFNINIYEYTEIDSFKLGYHDEYDYKDPTPSYGWDQDWEDVQWGGDLYDPSQDFYSEGFYCSYVFENIDDPATRELKSMAWGFDYVQGDLSAVFNSFSGTIDDSNDNTPELNGHSMNLGPATITCDPNDTGEGRFEMALNIDTYEKGYWVTFDNAVVTPN